MLKFFTDDVGDAFILDVSKVQALSIDPGQYIDENGETKNGTQVAVGSMWFQVKMEITDLANHIGLCAHYRVIEGMK